MVTFSDALSIESGLPREARMGRSVVEAGGLEPPTPCLQSRCSSQLSYAPRRKPRDFRGACVEVQAYFLDEFFR